MLSKLDSDQLILSKKCIAVEQSGDIVTVKFSDASSIKADMVIGADGVFFES